MRGLPHIAEHFKIEVFEARFLQLLRSPLMPAPNSDLLSGCCCFSWFPWPVFPSWLPVSVWLLLRIRGFCDIVLEHSAQQQPVWSLTSFFLVL